MKGLRDLDAMLLVGGLADQVGSNDKSSVARIVRLVVGSDDVMG